MSLKSKLLSGDPRLEACLVSDPAHITPGSRGDHVARIQLALNQLDDAELAFDGIYGLATAQAVTDYKNDPARRILQPSQKTADNIVGKRTIASLDSEMLAAEQAGARLPLLLVQPRPQPPSPPLTARPPGARLRFPLPAAL